MADSLYASRTHKGWLSEIHLIQENKGSHSSRQQKDLGRHTFTRSPKKLMSKICTMANMLPAGLSTKQAMAAF
jgi:hypothetical protein